MKTGVHEDSKILALQKELRFPRYGYSLFKDDEWDCSLLSSDNVYYLPGGDLDYFIAHYAKDLKDDASYTLPSVGVVGITIKNEFNVIGSVLISMYKHENTLKNILSLLDSNDIKDTKLLVDTLRKILTGKASGDWNIEYYYYWEKNNSFRPMKYVSLLLDVNKFLPEKVTEPIKNMNQLFTGNRIAINTDMDDLYNLKMDRDSTDYFMTITPNIRNSVGNLEVEDFYLENFIEMFVGYDSKPDKRNIRLELSLLLSKKGKETRYHCVKDLGGGYSSIITAALVTYGVNTPYHNYDPYGYKCFLYLSKSLSNVGTPLEESIYLIPIDVSVVGKLMNKQNADIIRYINYLRSEEISRRTVVLSNQKVRNEYLLPKKGKPIEMITHCEIDNAYFVTGTLDEFIDLILEDMKSKKK